jgi:hypothetical protein
MEVEASGVPFFCVIWIAALEEVGADEPTKVTTKPSLQ